MLKCTKRIRKLLSVEGDLSIVNESGYLNAKSKLFKTV